MSLTLHIITPEGPLAEAEVSKVALPGVVCPFVVLTGHAPMITALTEGEVVYEDAEGEKRVSIGGGFVEILDNFVSVCVER